MSNIKIAIWSAIIEPGKEYAMSVPRDFTLTNAALAEDLADPSGRSVVKLTHEVIPASRFGQAGEDDEDEEDEEKEDDDVEMQTVVVTSLTAGKNEQSLLNLTFVEDEEIVFTVSGSNVVHLSGNYIDQDPSDGEPGSDEEDFDSEGGEWSDDEDMMDEDEEVSAKITEIPSGKRSAEAAGIDVAEAAVGELTKAQKKKLNKKLKGEDGAAAAAPSPVEKKAEPKVEKKDEKKSNKKTLPSGLIIEDSKLGTGAVAKSGKKVGMRYIGKLANGKVFDSNTNGKPFVFNLGKGEVIKGWDQGVAGMAIGGERKLVIPAPLAYGSKALPGIPKNSTLHFEVKLVSVN